MRSNFGNSRGFFSAPNETARRRGGAPHVVKNAV